MLANANGHWSISLEALSLGHTRDACRLQYDRNMQPASKLHASLMETRLGLTTGFGFRL